MEKDKYYTPELSEFHVGFEFEQKEYSGLRWLSKEMGWQGVKKIKSYNEQGLIRVKYLDQEDIESLGFEEGGSWDYTSGDFRIQFPMKDNRMPNHNVIIHTSHAGAYFMTFCGVIKNKSELKRVLKQVGYEQPKQDNRKYGEFFKLNKDEATNSSSRTDS